MTMITEMGRGAGRGCGAALGMVALWALPLAGQTVSIDETRTLSPDASVELSVVSHSLVVEGWDRDEVQVTGEYDSEYEDFEVGGGARSFHLEIRPKRGLFDSGRQDRDGSAELVVRLPRGVRLEAETVSGSVTIGGLGGVVSASAVSGTVEVEGDLRSASLEAVSGSVTYRGDASSSVRLESVSGRVEFEGAAESAQLESVSGTVRMEGGAERIDATSVSGGLELGSSVPVRSLEAETVSGSVRYSGPLAPGGEIEVESHSGSVELELAADTDAEFDLSTFSGEITAEVPGARDEVRSESRFTPERLYRFVTGGGSAEVEASSFSGSIRILVAER